MADAANDSTSNSPFLNWEDDDSSAHLNEACLLSDDELPFVDRGSSCDFSNMVVPETPESPLAFRRKRHSQVTDHYSGAALCEWDSNERRERKNVIPGYLYTTPSSNRTMKRRRVQETVHAVSDAQAENRIGFAPASSLLWLGSPCPSQSTVCSSSSSVSYSATAPEELVLGDAAGQTSKISPSSHAHDHKILKSKKEHKPKKTSTRTNHGPSRRTSTTTSHVAGERHFQNTEAEREDGHVQDSIISVEEVVVEATVRAIQMAEDEAFARSLQQQFDREEWFHQEQNRLQTTSPNRHQQNLPLDTHVGLSWISPWASMVHSASFSEMEQEVGIGQSSRQTRVTRGGRSSRRRNGPHVSLELLDDSQGNNYEALLAFEENQGAVMAKKTLSKREIDRLPSKAYDPKHSAGKTECQICFSDYKKGEKLRMLPCFHDYHVKCIDRWLKENATCPICRADVSL